MKKLLTSMALAVAALSATMSAQAITVSMNPALQAIGVTGAATVDIVVSGLDAATEIVSAYDLTVLFDPTLLAWSVVTQYFLPFGGGGSVSNSFDSSVAGALSLDLVSSLSDALLDGLQGDSVTLFTMSFTGLTDGAAALEFGPSPFFARNVEGRTPVVGGPTPSLDATYIGACVAIGTGGVCRQQVPEPASYGLVAMALFAAGVAGRTRKPLAV